VLALVPLSHVTVPVRFRNCRIAGTKRSKERLAAALVSGQAHQLGSHRVDLGAELINAPQRRIDVLASRRRQLSVRERRAARFG
jgi:hypothetical protein